MDPDSVATTGDHVYVENRAAIDCAFTKGSVGRVAGSIRSIGIDLSHILAFAQEVERDPGVSPLPVSQRADIPVLAASPRQGDVPHGEPVDHAHLIPRSRHLLNEVE